MVAVASEGATRRVHGWATTMHLDRSNDTIDPTGVNFELPFPLLFNHDHAKPIGKVTKMTQLVDGWLATAEILAPGSTTAADEAWNMITQQAIKGFSVGFIPQEAAPNEQGGMHFKKIAVHELSVCAVPCNPKAEILGHSNVKAAPKTATSVRKPTANGNPQPMLLLRNASNTPARQTAAILAQNEAARAYNRKHGFIDAYV